jgi:1-acyl-sn-glycerol-3-phosphate acyltransferase
MGLIMTTNNRNTQNVKPGLGYKIFTRYVRFFHNKIYYREAYSINAENIPQNCPLLVVSNHQNSLCDPLGLLLSIQARDGRKPKVITRADVFDKPLANKLLRWLGLLPAYRMNIDGVESMANNADTFEEAEEELLNNGTVIIFPESRHQDKRWLGKFSSGYLRIAFEAAKKSNFEKEIFILPSCNHYANYFDIQEEMVIKYGTPISIAPYYELFKSKPRTAQREVNALVRQQVSGLMLDITDLDNYQAIDFLRNTYGVRYAKEKGYNPNKLPEKFLADKALYAELEDMKRKDENQVSNIYNDALVLEEKMKRLKINDRDFDKKFVPWKVCLQGLMLAVLAPLFLLSLLPNALILYAPRYVTSKVKDPMLHSAIFLILSLLVTVPSSYLILFALTWIITKSLLISLIYLVCLPFLVIFVWQYDKVWKKWKSQYRFGRLLRKNDANLDYVTELRSHVYESLDNMLNIRKKTLVRNIYERYVQPIILRTKRSS